MRKIDNVYFLYKILIIISFIYGYVVGEGFYGYSNDFYAEYYKRNLIYPSIREFGSLLSTLTLFDFHIGVHLTSFFLSLSTGMILKIFFEIKKANSLFVFLLIYIVTLHTHPIIMSTSGAMRQGWTMIFIFFSFFFLLKEKNLLSFFCIFISVFLHKSGLYFFNLYLVMIFTSILSNHFKDKKIILFISSLAYLLIAFYYSEIAELKRDNIRVVAGDFRFLWLVVNISYVLFYFYFFDISPLFIKKISLFFLFYSVTAPLFFYLGLNYHYERINMIISIPLILTIASYFKKKSFNFILIIFMIVYLFFTILQGMYSIGLT